MTNHLFSSHKKDRIQNIFTQNFPTRRLVNKFHFTLILVDNLSYNFQLHKFQTIFDLLYISNIYLMMADEFEI